MLVFLVFIILLVLVILGKKAFGLLAAWLKPVFLLTLSVGVLTVIGMTHAMPPDQPNATDFDLIAWLLSFSLLGLVILVPYAVFRYLHRGRQNRTPSSAKPPFNPSPKPNFSDHQHR